MLTVVAAVIESAGKVLVCQRKRGDTLNCCGSSPEGSCKPANRPPKP